MTLSDLLHLQTYAIIIFLIEPLSIYTLNETKEEKTKRKKIETKVMAPASVKL